MKYQKTKKYFKYSILFLLSIIIIWVCNFLILGNFHKVDNNMYRSAQLFHFNMPYYVKKHEIKSILNLRGPSEKSWYKDEISFSKKNNIKHYDYHIGDREVQSLNTMKELIEIIKSSPKPILIHCKAGADRTSLVAALYLHSIKNDKNSKKQISIKYGHFPWLGSRTIAMDQSFNNYKTINQNSNIFFVENEKLYYEKKDNL